MTWKDYVNLDKIRKDQLIYDQQKDEMIKARLKLALKKEQRETEHQQLLGEIAKKAKVKEEKLNKRKRQEEFRGEYMDYNCPSCDGKLKIGYTKWSAAHFAKSICESCDRFDRWLPKPKPDNEFV